MHVQVDGDILEQRRHAHDLLQRQPFALHACAPSVVVRLSLIEFFVVHGEQHVAERIGKHPEAGDDRGIRGVARRPFKHFRHHGAVVQREVVQLLDVAWLERDGVEQADALNGAVGAWDQ